MESIQASWMAFLELDRGNLAELNAVARGEGKVASIQVNKGYWRPPNEIPAAGKRQRVDAGLPTCQPNAAGFDP